jgi:hypothetical protein
MQAASNLIVVTGIAALVILYVLGLINTRRGAARICRKNCFAGSSVSQWPWYSLSSSIYGLAASIDVGRHGCLEPNLHKNGR